METIFTKLLNKQVKVLFLDNGRTKVVEGILNEIKENYIIVDSVVIGLGSNFISCLPQEGK